MNTVPKLMDHNTYVERLCLQVEAGRPEATADLCSAWRWHARMDIDVVYPSLPASFLESEGLAARARADHRLVDRLIGQIERTPAAREHRAAAAGLLVRLIREHVVAEERAVFPELVLGGDVSRFSVDPPGYPSVHVSSTRGGPVSVPSPQFNDLPDPCSFGVHDWVTKRNDEREDYDVCLRCGQQASWTPLPPEGLVG